MFYRGTGGGDWWDETLSEVKGQSVAQQSCSDSPVPQSTLRGGQESCHRPSRSAGVGTGQEDQKLRWAGGVYELRWAGGVYELRSNLYYKQRHLNTY